MKKQIYYKTILKDGYIKLSIIKWSDVIQRLIEYYIEISFNVNKDINKEIKIDIKTRGADLIDIKPLEVLSEDQFISNIYKSNKILNPYGISISYAEKAFGVNFLDNNVVNYYMRLK